MPQDTQPPSDNQTGAKDLADQIAKLRETIDRRSAAQEAISRSMAEAAAVLASANKTLGESLEANTKELQAKSGDDKNPLALLGNKGLIVTAVILGGVLVLFVAMRFFVGDSEEAAVSLAARHLDKFQLAVIFAVLTAALASIAALMRRGDRAPPAALDLLTKLSGYATILAFLLALAEFSGARLDVDSSSDDLKVGFRVIGAEQPGGGGGTGTYPLILIGPFASGKHDIMDLKSSLDEGARTCAPIVEQRDLKEQVCAARAKLDGASLAIIIGRHDRDHIKDGAEKEVYSNAAIAERRADTVARMLSEAVNCAPFSSEPPVMVAMSATPRVVMGKGMACDRMVEIIALKRGVRY
jgi:hypothetical protein